MHRSTGRAASAILAGLLALLASGCKTDPASQHLHRAQDLLVNHRRAAGRLEVDAAIRVRPTHLSPYLAAMGMYDEARMLTNKAEIGELLLERAEKMEPPLTERQQAAVHAEVGRAYWDAKMPVDAESHYAKALALDPQNGVLMNDFGYFYAQQGIRLHKALSLTREAVRLSPGDGAAIDSLGWVLYRLGRYSEARATMTRAVVILPDHAEIRYHLGAIHEKRDSRAAARVELGKALVLDNSLTEARQLRVRLGGPSRAGHR